MHIVDRRLNPGGKSLENRQRFLRRAKALVQRRGQEVVAGPGHQGCPGGRRSRDPARRHGRAALPPRGRHARHGAAGQQEIRRRRHPSAAELAAAARAGQRRRRRQRGRVPLRADPGGVRRPVPRRSRTARPRQAQACRDRAARGCAAPATPPPARPPTSRSAARCGCAWRGGSRCGGRARKRSRSWRRSSTTCEDDGAARSSLMAEIAALKSKLRRIPVHRSDRHPLSPLRDDAEAGGAGGDVLPDGRVRLDDRAHEGSRQALLHAALRVPEAALPPRRDRLHPPYRPRRGGRRGDILPRPGDRRHAGLHRAGGDATRSSQSRFRPADWNIYAAQASDGDNSIADGERGGPASDRRDPAGQPVSSPIWRSARRPAAPSTCRIPRCGRSIERLRTDGAPLSMRKVSDRSEIFPVFHELFQRRGHTQETDRAMTASQPERLLRGRRLEFRDAAAHPRRLRGDRARRARARRLSEPDRGHHRRADARRLFLDRHAAVLQALVVRQAFRPSRGVLPQGPDGSCL